MNRRLLLLVFTLFTIVSCSHVQVERGLTALERKPIETAFRILGYPSQKMEVPAGTVYYWSNQRTGMLTLPATSNTFGVVGGAPFNVTTNSTRMVPVSMYGEIQICANKQDIIYDWSFNGNDAGLARYASILGKYARNIEVIEGKKRRNEGVPQAKAAYEQ